MTTPEPNSSRLIADNSPSINTEQFEEMRDLLEEDFHDLVVTYMADSQARVAQLQQAQADNDNQAGFDVAHTMKGAGLNLGLTRLNALCLQVEDICRHQTIATEAAAELISQVAAEVEQSNQDIQQRLLIK